MAQRRMFSPEIVASDAFLDMPVSSQLLYFHLGMHADDDGFVSPKRVMRSVGTTDDDLKILMAKRFVIPFESGVIVVKHWRINNFIRKDRYKPTLNTEQKNQLYVKENGAYTLDKKQGLPSAMVPWQSDETKRLTSGQPNDIPVVDAGKDRLGKDTKYNPLGAEIIKAFEAVDPKNKGYYGNTSQRSACDFLLDEYGLEETIKRISVLTKTNKLSYFPSITTPVQLRDKWVPLQDAVERKRGEKKNSVAFT